MPRCPTTSSLTRYYGTSDSEMTNAIAVILGWLMAASILVTFVQTPALLLWLAVVIGLLYWLNPKP